MKKIVGIGGAVIKTGMGEELKKRINDIEMLIYNGGALFHDFQLALEGYTSVPIKDLNLSLKGIENSSLYLWDYLKGNKEPPINSLADTCKKNNVPILLFTGLGCDYWQMFDTKWDLIGNRCQQDFEKFKARTHSKPFHYLNMGSAVIHPEVFLKAIQGVPYNFRADVVDFLDMYRPRTRVAIYGEYYQMPFDKFFKEKWKVK